MESVLLLFSSYCVFVMTEVFRESDKLRVLTFKIRDIFAEYSICLILFVSVCKVTNYYSITQIFLVFSHNNTKIQE